MIPGEVITLEGDIEQRPGAAGVIHSPPSFT